MVPGAGLILYSFPVKSIEAARMDTIFMTYNHAVCTSPRGGITGAEQALSICLFY